MCLIAALWEHMNPPFRALVKILTTAILHQFIVHVLLFQDEWDVFLDAMNRNEISRTLLKFGLKNPDNQFFFISPQVLKRSSVMKKIVIESVSLRSTSDPSLHFTLPTFTFYSYTLCTYVYSLLYGFKVCKYTQMKSCEKQIINI